MNVQRLVVMANDICDYFAARPDPEAVVEGVRDHLARFWDPRMRRRLIEYIEAGGADLSLPAAEAVRRLAAGR